MRTYIPDQWLRNWFVGGSEVVDYSNRGQVTHLSPDDFASDLRLVWRNSLESCAHDACMVIRFGGISDRNVDPIEIIKHSLYGSGWSISTIKGADSATRGKRQADTFLRIKSKPIQEFDIWALKR
jgi:hypothetical protein